MANVIIEEPISTRNKPSGSAFKQQKLPAWQPILTAGTVLPTFFFIGFAFVPIGIGLLFSSNAVQEKIIDYTDCVNLKKQSCDEVVRKRGSCICEVEFNLENNITGEVFIYYGLTNFYQNHRRYVKSRDDRQLLGIIQKELSSDCKPFAMRDGKQIAPCGAIANSLFNDSFILFKYENGFYQHLEINVKGIAWATDKNVKFRNPSGKLNQFEAFKDTVPPPNWVNKTIYTLDTDDKNNGYVNDALIVWMRTASLPTFRKLYARIEPKEPATLPKGMYKVRIKYNYPVKSFKGTKKIIISNTSWLGGKNPFLGIAYIVVGCLCLILTAVFFVIHRKFGKSTDEMISINQRTSYLNE